MIDESKKSFPENPSEVPSSVSGPIPSKPKKPSKYLWYTLLAIVFMICLFVAVYLKNSRNGLNDVEAAKVPIASVLDTYMKHMEAKDVKSAYALFSLEFQQKIPISTIEELVVGNNYVLFDGYQSLVIQNVNISTTTSSKSDAPIGVISRVTGTLKYEGNFEGVFNATLEKVEQKWLIYRIKVTVPPDKVQP